jgi:polyisoprenoid-binding protein YceI
MNKSILAIIAAVFILSFTGKIMHVDSYTVDTKQSVLEWYAEKVTGKHNGTIMASGGEIKSDHGKLAGTIEFDMTTIANKDIEDEKSKAKLEGHLKSPDFFDVEKYPKSSFTITSVTPVVGAKAGESTHNIKGNMTIKDKTNEITFGSIVTMKGDKLTCTGAAVIDRSKFDVRYGSKTFFADIGDKMINDEFTLKFNLVAVKQ